MGINLEHLNPQQRTAVEHRDGPMLVFAGAGSGKTQALTFRIAYLISEHGVSPQNILAVTFTNKAAKEMRERTGALVGTSALGQMWVGTFHATCARILREKGDRMGLSPEFVIYDADDQAKAVRECLEELGFDERENNAKKILFKISQAKERLVQPQDYEKVMGTSYDPVVARVYPLYQKKLRTNNSLDFDDLIFYAVRLLTECPEVRERYQQRFKYVLVDEYQDINQSQFQLVKLIADGTRNICVVGDDDQSIYSWRGADVSIILSFQKHYPDAKVVKLEQNYRSTKNILEAAHHVIRRNENRAQKQLWTERGDGTLLNLIDAVDEHDEAVKIVNRIKDRAIEQNREYSDFVILYRMNAQSRIFEEALMNHRIPYKIIGGLRFYERKEIKDLMAYLRLAYNPMDSIGMKRIINIPARGIGAVTVERIEHFALRNDLSMFNAMLRVNEIDIQPRASRAIASLAKLIAFANEKRNEYPVSKLLHEIVEHTAYVLELKKLGTREADSRVENVMELFSVVEEFERTSEDITLRAFLEQVALVTDIDSYDEEEPAVTLMTLHAAKGLEFPVVFMGGMEDGIFPHSRSMTSRDELEEERRLCYVGMTRAKDELFLSHASTRTTFGMRERQIMSRFLKEIPAEMFATPKRPVVAGRGESASSSSSSWYSPEPVRKVSSSAKKCQFCSRDYVRHPIFGLGIVEVVEPAGNDYQLTITFEEVGRKKLMLSYVSLERVEL
jgi:DNA helicase-2/ATP-dependent DNA helicase PcrA